MPPALRRWGCIRLVYIEEVLYGCGRGDELMVGEPGGAT
jgi:hypothetical protein